ncbi:MAG: hypothetical protein QOG72_3248 [Sphingomonadales bacterium]|jgi:hypothetical protein|nr:hypothetical protein [Sphingomonadales bacterium]
MRTAALAIALLLSGSAFAQTTTTTQPDVDVDAHVGTQPDGDPDVDLDVDVGSKTKTTTVNPDGTAATTSTSTTDGPSDGTMPTDVATAGTMTVATNVTPPMNPVVQPSNAAPERDARGIAVISDAAVVPAGFNGTTGTGVGGPMIDPATGKAVTGADVSHPPCTATVTDNCVQTYERGRRR